MPKDTRSQIENFAFNELPSIENPLTLNQVRKLVGHNNYYRARFGDYRVGLIIDQKEKTVQCCRVKHRKDIYRFFP